MLVKVILAKDLCRLDFMTQFLELVSLEFES